MDELILSLLKKNGRVIIPDFGALIVKQKTPFRVIFNEFLQYNDGTLINALMSENQNTQDESTAKVKQLSEMLLTKLNSGSEISLPGIGVLVKNSSGKVTLTPESDNEIPQNETPAVEPEAEKVRHIPEVELIENEKNEPGIKEEPVQTFKTVQPEKPDPVIPQPAPTPVNEYYENEPQKNWLNIVLWISLIVIVNGAIFGFFFFGDEIKSVFKIKNKTEKPITKQTENKAVVSDSNEIIQEQPEAETELLIEPTLEESVPEAVTKSQAVNPAGTKYYIVAGVFRDEHNADKLVDDLRKKNYNAEKFGKIGQMWAVSYEVFATKKEADNYLSKIKTENDPDAWIRIVD